MKRFNLVRGSGLGFLNIIMRRDPQGDWVQYETAQLKIIELENKIKVLETSRDYFKRKAAKRSLSGDH